MAHHTHCYTYRYSKNNVHERNIQGYEKKEGLSTFLEATILLGGKRERCMSMFYLFSPHWLQPVFSVCQQKLPSVSSSSWGAERTAAGQTTFTSLTNSRNLLNQDIFMSAPWEDINTVCIYWFIDFISPPTVASEGNLSVVKQAAHRQTRSLDQSM